jgi:HSP20 family molecular chaperone IbpA
MRLHGRAALTSTDRHSKEPIMTQTPMPSSTPGQPQAGREYGEAGDPGDPQAQGSAGGSYSGSVQARRGAQGQVSARSGTRTAPREAAAMAPPVDIFEDEDGVTLLADMPGVSREQLQVRVDGDTLLIEGLATVPDTGELELVHGELLSPHYKRSFTLSRDLDAQSIEARLEQGVLRLRIHKSEQAKPRRIEIQAG